MDLNHASQPSQQPCQSSAELAELGARYFVDDVQQSLSVSSKGLKVVIGVTLHHSL